MTLISDCLPSDIKRIYVVSLDSYVLLFIHRFNNCVRLVLLIMHENILNKWRLNVLNVDVCLHSLTFFFSLSFHINRCDSLGISDIYNGLTDC